MARVCISVISGYVLPKRQPRCLTSGYVHIMIQLVSGSLLPIRPLLQPFLPDLSDHEERIHATHSAGSWHAHQVAIVLAMYAKQFHVVTGRAQAPVFQLGQTHIDLVDLHPPLVRIEAVSGANSEIAEAAGRSYLIAGSAT